MPVIDLSRLLTSRLFWELLLIAGLALAVVTQTHRLDQWRGMVREAEVLQQLHALNEETTARDQAIGTLKARLVERDQTIQRVHVELERVKASRPTLSAVAQRVQKASVTDEGVVAEAHRLLPGMAIRLSTDSHCR